MVGSHLFERLQANGKDVLGTYFRPTVNLEEVSGQGKLVELDVRYRGEVEFVLRAERPDVIFHLASQSFPTRSWIAPEETISVNVLGTVNLFEVIKALRGEDPDYDPMVVVACSSAEYGASLTPENVPIKETAQLLPLHPYGVSKVGQDLLAYQYWVNDKIRSIRARIFNTTGPRKHGDVISDLSQRAAAIKRSGGKLRVGNTAARRAILDVQDLISALVALSERGVPGEVYNICSDELYSIDELIDLIEDVVGVKLEREVDPSLLRLSDEPVIFGDNRKLKEATGWHQQFSIAETIRRVVEYEFARLR